MDEPRFLSDTRAGYDVIAVGYAERFQDELADKPLDRAMLNAYADLVRADGGGRVADVGCGPGRSTGYLDSQGLDVRGIDLSPRMVALARREQPDLRFEEGSMTALDLPDGSLSGVVAFYSTIHIPDRRLPQVFAEFHRVLAPGGRVLVAFQVGDEPRRYTEAFGHPVRLDFHRRRPERVRELLAAAGLATHACLLREPEGDETTPHAYLLARKATEEQAAAGQSSPGASS